MNENEWLAKQFEAYRPHLQAVAYRLRGRCPPEQMTPSRNPGSISVAALQTACKTWQGG